MDVLVSANYMLYITVEACGDVTNMKLNKLLYYCQGYYLCEYNTSLFCDAIEAWEHGPVIPRVYEAYKCYGNQPIMAYNESMVSRVDKQKADFFYKIASKFAGYNASELRAMTHAKDSPWSYVYRENIRHVIISQPIIKNYFDSLEELKPFDIEFRDDDFVGCQDKNGYLVLPKEWYNAEDSEI